MVLVVEASLPPRKSQLSQLPAMVSQSSRYRQDDRAADAARADGGDESHEVRDFADVGELVEQAVHIAAEPATIRVVGFPDQSLEEALVEHAGQ